MSIKAPLPVFCVVVCLGVALVACERTPPAPVASPPPAAAPSAKPQPTTSVQPDVASQPAVETPAPTSTQVEDWALPGNIGPLTTRLELETRFGKANVREETFDGPEGGGRYPVLVVFPDDPHKRLELVQNAENPDAPITELRISDPASNWHDAKGLRPGMTLTELVALNGAPVSFYGLAWDYGGVVQDWHGGNLANAVDAATFHRVALAARKNAVDARLPQGDASFRSDDTHYPTIGKDLVVGEVGISWPHEGED